MRYYYLSKVRKTFFYLVILSSFLAFNALAQDIDSRSRAVEHYNSGVYHHEKEKLNKAIEEYSEAVRLDPSLYEAHWNLGIIYVQKGMTDSAIKELEAVVKLKPDIFEGHFALGNLYHQKKLMDEAIKEFKAAVALRPNDYDARLGLAVMYHEKEDNRAIREYKKAISIKPNSEIAHYNLGLIYYYNSDFGNAIKEFHKVAEINPNNKQVGEILKVLEEYDKEKISDTLPKEGTPSATKRATPWSLIFVVTSILLLWLWDVISGKIGYKKSIGRNIKRMEKCKKVFSLAESLSLKKETNAIELYKRVIEILSDKNIQKYFDVKEYLSKSYFGQARLLYEYALASYEEIRALLNKALSFDGDDLEICYFLGEVCFGAGEYYEAEKHFMKIGSQRESEAKKEGPTLADRLMGRDSEDEGKKKAPGEQLKEDLIHLWLGRTCYEIGKYGDAIQELTSIKLPIKEEKSPWEYIHDDLGDLSQKAINCLALAYYETENFENAIEKFKLLRENYGDIDPKIYYYFGRVCRRTGQYTEALKSLGQYLEYNPADYAGYIERGRTLMKKGLSQKAYEDFLKALELHPEGEDTIYAIGEYFYLNNEIEKSLSQFNQAINKNPHFLPPHYRKGNICEKTGKYQKAIEEYELVTFELPNRSDVRTRIGIAYCKQKDYSQAMEHLYKAEQMGDRSNQLLYYFGLALVNLERYGEGLQRWKELFSRNSQDKDLESDICNVEEVLKNKSGALLNNAFSAMKDQNWKKAHSIFKEIMDLNPVDKKATKYLAFIRNNLCFEYIEKSKREEVAEIWKDEIRRNPTNYEVLHNLALLYYWWAIEEERNNQDAIYTTSLWRSTIAFWTSLVNNDNFWDRWENKNNQHLREEEIKNISNKLIHKLEDTFLRYIDSYRKSGKNERAKFHEGNLKRLRLEKKFISYYEDMKEILKDDKIVLPDAYGESLIEEFNLRDYINTLLEMALEKEPDNEKLKKMRYWLSPYREIFLLTEENRFEEAIDKYQKLPTYLQDEVLGKNLLGTAFLKRGGQLVEEERFSQARTYWDKCDSYLADDNFIKDFIIDVCEKKAQKLEKSKNFDGAIEVLELCAEYYAECEEIVILLSRVYCHRGIEKWNKGQYQEGLNDVEMAIDYNPGNRSAKDTLSFMHRNLQGRGWLGA
jgi:tetratricopeptide (TPR) repeat protein